MTFDVIITTYNRPERVEQFVQSILTCHLLPDQIIVVDSSDIPHPTIHTLHKVRYIKSSHKNQPYQRYLGATQSNAEVVCFFDDDLEMINKDIFNLLMEPYKQDKVAGSSVGIDYQNSISDKTPESLIKPSSGWPQRLLQLSGVKFPPPGKISYAGMTGEPPMNIQQIDFFYGPCMSFRRNIFNQTFNTQLLDLFEQKLGMGEDKVISMLATQYGILMYNPVTCLYHPAIESTYFQNVSEYTAKTLYSRRFLNDIFIQVNKKNKQLGSVHLWWYIMGRVCISTLTYIIKPQLPRKLKLKGLLQGMKLLMFNNNKTTYNWMHEINIDSKK